MTEESITPEATTGYLHIDNGGPTPESVLTVTDGSPLIFANATKFSVATDEPQVASTSRKMSFEDAADDISDVMALLSIAYKKLMAVQKSCPKPEGYPLKDVIVTLGTAELTLVIVREQYLKMDG